MTTPCDHALLERGAIVVEPGLERNETRGSCWRAYCVLRRHFGFSEADYDTNQPFNSLGLTWCSEP
jgi:hypothetical protein